MYLKNEHLEQTDFLHDATNPGKLKVASMIFRYSRCDLLVHETLKYCLKIQFMNWADFLHADSDAIIFD